MTGMVHAGEKRPVVLEDVKATQSYLLNLGHTGEGQVLDYNGDGCVDVYDLALAKRELMETGVPSLTELSADIRDVYIGKRTNVTFTVKVKQIAQLNKDAVKLCDETGEAVAVMNDEGKNGDVARNDGIYTAIVPLLGNDIRQTSYYAYAEGVQSAPIDIGFYRNLTDEENAGFDALMAKIAPMKYEEVCKYLKNCKEVTDFSADDEQRIIILDTIYHITGMWLPQEWEETEAPKETTTPKQGAIGGIDIPHLASDIPIEPKAALMTVYTDTTRSTEITTSTESTTTTTTERNPIPLAGRPDPFEDVDYSNGWEQIAYAAEADRTDVNMHRAVSHTITTGTKKGVAVLCPYYSSYGLENKDKKNAVAVGNRVAEKLGSGSAVVFKDGEVTLQQMKSLSQYGVVILSTNNASIKGDKSVRESRDVIGKIWMILGSEDEEHLHDNDPDIELRRVIKAVNTIPNAFNCRYAISKDFITHYYPNGTLYNSFWYLNCPQSMCKTLEGSQSAGFGDALISAGAGAVAGYDNSVIEVNDCNAMMNDVFNALLDGKTLKDAKKSLSNSNVFLYQEKLQKTFMLQNASMQTSQAGQQPNTGELSWSVGTAVANPGDYVSIPIRVYNDVDCYGCAFTVNWNNRLLKIDDIAGYYSYYPNPFKVAADKKGRYRMVWSDKQAPDGQRVWQLNFKIPTGTSPGIYPIELSDCRLYTSPGIIVQPIFTNGYIKVEYPSQLT